MLSMRRRFIIIPQTQCALALAALPALLSSLFLRCSTVLAARAAGVSCLTCCLCVLVPFRTHVMPKLRQKQRLLKIEEKLEIIRAIECGSKKSVLARETDLPLTNVCVEFGIPRRSCSAVLLQPRNGAGYAVRHFRMWRRHW